MPVKCTSSPRAGLGVETLAVAALGDLKRRIDVDLEELAVADQACRASSRSARNGEMNEHSTISAGVDHQPGNLSHAPDVLDAVGIGEAEVLVQPVPNVVAVEQVGVAALLVRAASRRGWRSSTCRRPKDR